MFRDDIKNFTLGELEEAMGRVGEPAFRARQIFSWLYQRDVRNFDDMRNISETVRNKLSQRFCITSLILSERLRSIDGTEKFLFKLSDGNFIEAVLICSGRRKTICLSTQIGCKFACSFCASGLKAFVRDLTASEIVNQILFLQRNLKHRITNYVFMGMGEPLDNYENVLKAIMIMNGPQGMGIGARRITVSTCGIIPEVEKLRDSGFQVNLSVSLHAANNRLRDELVPINKRYPLGQLIKVCEDFMRKSGRIITFEYVLIKGRNDSLRDADELAVLIKGLKAKVNLIPYSPVAALGLQPSDEENQQLFMKRLIGKKLNATLRQSKGSDIQAACGQLAGRAKE